MVRHSYLIDSLLEDGAVVGPFAYLRPGSVLRAGSKVGTFVEVKGSDIGAGTKIPHLSYIGDADVGERSNLGAGTITANYDGHAKHRTTIGSGVRGGVDTAFVAPVTVGDGAYTGGRIGRHRRRPRGRPGDGAGQAEEHRGLRTASRRRASQGRALAGERVVSVTAPMRAIARCSRAGSRARPGGPLHCVPR